MSFFKTTIHKKNKENWKNKEKWGSRWGFTLAAVSSAIGLSNIWRFPLLVARYGGGAFLLVYLFCLLVAGLPLFLLEALVGRESGKSPYQALYEITKRPLAKAVGALFVLSGFFVSCYYAVISGWVVGYSFQAFTGELSLLSDAEGASAHFATNISSLSFSYLWPQLFLLSSALVLAAGVRGGVEKASKFLMPLLFLLLLLLTFWSLCGVPWAPLFYALFSPEWSKITAEAFLVALGQAFFSLSLGQGTLIAYGSYLKREEPLLSLAFPVLLADTLISLLATLLLFSISLQTGVRLDAGPGLVFETLPILFNRLPFGGAAAALFFSVLLLATLTSQLSAMEPVVSACSARWGRRRALLFSSMAMLLVLFPAALSYRGVLLGWWSSATLLWHYEALCTRFLIPFSGALLLLFARKGWGIDAVMQALQRTDFRHGFWAPFAKIFFYLCFQWVTPVLVMLIFFFSFFGI